MHIAAYLLFCPVLIAHTDAKGHHNKAPRRTGPVNSEKEAKAIAELETSGVAVSARRIHLNGASCGWEVDVHMPKEDRGWRCIIDCDTHSVYTKDRIPNPDIKKRHRS